MMTHFKQNGILKMSCKKLIIKEKKIMKQNVKRFVSFILFLMLIFANALICDTTTVMATSKTPTKITLNHMSMSTYVGGKVNLKVKAVTPKSASKSVTWKSSNPKIATVTKSGVVNAKKTGNVKITATSKTNRSVKATCKIKVYKATKKIKLTTKSKYTLEVGAKKTLKAKVTNPTKGAQQVQWSSENPEIAKVNSKGKVTAVKVGTTYIVAKSGGKSVKTKIKVVDHSQPFSLSQTEFEIENIQFVKLPLNHDPGDIVWKSADPSIADVIDNRLFALKEGTTKITGTSAGQTVTLTITVIHSIIYNEPIQKVSLKKLSNCYLVIYNNPKLPNDAEKQIENVVSNVEKYTGLKFVTEEYDSLPYIILTPLGLVHPCADSGMTCIDDWSLENKKIKYSSIDPAIHELTHSIRARNRLYGGTAYEEGIAMYNAWKIKNKYYGYNEKDIINYNAFDVYPFKKDEITINDIEKYLFVESPDSQVPSVYFVPFMAEKYGMKTIDKIIKETHSKIGEDDHGNPSYVNKYIKDITIKYTSKNVVNDFYNWLVQKGYLPKK